MKTTEKMSKKLLAVGLLGLVLALGVTLVGCDDGGGGDNPSGGGISYDGTYRDDYGEQKLVLSGSNFVKSIFDATWVDCEKGTFAVSKAYADCLTFTVTHEYNWGTGNLEPVSSPFTRDVTIHGGGTIRYDGYNYTKQ